MVTPMLHIPGDYLEGGGQILRTAVALSCITKSPIHVTNIRLKRKAPGLKAQHLHAIMALAGLFKADAKGLELGSKEITFLPTIDYIEKESLDIDIATAGSIGLILQPLLLVSSFRSKGISLRIKGGTCGLGAIPVDYYKNVIIPTLSRSGLVSRLDILKRGYYPKGGGEIRVDINEIRQPKEICLIDRGQIQHIEGISIASDVLSNRKVAERQAQEAGKIIKERLGIQTNIKTEYTHTLSPGSEINLYAYTEKNCILGGDSHGERGKPAEKVGEEAALRLLKELESGAACDTHLADNLIPWLALLGGTIMASEISLHTKTNIWVCEQFFGKIFNVAENNITCQKKE